MNCQQCGSEVIELVDSDGGVTEGQFVENYECVDCGARGQIRGNAEAAPNEWRKLGSLYNDY